MFAETHQLALRWCARARSTGCGSTTPTAWPTRPATSQRLRAEGVEHVWVEKILDPGEKLRDWPVDGTVGYEFLNDVAALFVDPAGEAPLDALWDEIVGRRAPVRRAARSRRSSSRRRARSRPTSSGSRRELTPRAGRRPRATRCRRCRSTAPMSSRSPGKVADADREAIAEAGIPEPLARMLLLEEPAPPEFVTRFQQTTPPVMAKGVEDTAFYRYARLLALNEVGGDPSRFGISVDEFHAGQPRAARALPAQPAGHADARHQALGRRAGAHRRAGGDGRRVGAARAALVRR